MPLTLQREVRACFEKILVPGAGPTFDSSTGMGDVPCHQSAGQGSPGNRSRELARSGLCLIRTTVAVGVLQKVSELVPADRPFVAARNRGFAPGQACAMLPRAPPVPQPLGRREISGNLFTSAARRLLRPRPSSAVASEASRARTDL